MRQFLSLMILLSCLLSCKTKTENVVATKSFQLLIPDTTNNRRAQVDLRIIQHCSQIAKQLGFKDLQKGVDSFEVRAWYDFSFSNYEELYILKLLDTSYSVSYFRFYCRSYDYDNENRNRQWNAYTQPIIDSCISKTVLLQKDDLKDFSFQEVWNLHSQSELKIPDSIGFTDCYTHTIEVADKRRYKFMSHHCSEPYFDKLKIKDINNFIEYFREVGGIAYKHNVRVPNVYD